MEDQMPRSCITVAVAFGCIVFGSVLALAEQKTSYLFVQEADEVIMKTVPGGQNAYQITMVGVGPEAIYFADQPQRKAGMINQTDFMAVFAKERVKKIQPNAALVWNTPDRGALVVKLTSGSYRSQDNTLVYEATMLPSAQGGLAEFDQRKASGSLPERVSKAMLFIDDFGCSPWGPRDC
jgi:hypothetical protein